MKRPSISQAKDNLVDSTPERGRSWVVSIDDLRRNTYASEMFRDVRASVSLKISKRVVKMRIMCERRYEETPRIDPVLAISFLRRAFSDSLFWVVRLAPASIFSFVAKRVFLWRYAAMMDGPRDLLHLVTS